MSCDDYLEDIQQELLNGFIPGHPGWGGIGTVRNIDPLLLSLSSNSSQALLTFSPKPLSLPLGSDTKENPGKRLKQTWRTWGQEPTFPLCSPNSGFVVNRWFPLTHSCHCMTTSWPAAATQMIARVSTAMQPKA